MSCRYSFLSFFFCYQFQCFSLNVLISCIFFAWNFHVFLLKTEILAWKILQPFFTCIHGCWVMDIRQMGYSLKRNGCKKWVFALLKCIHLTLSSKNHFPSKMETIFFLIFFCNRTLLLFAGSKVAALSEIRLFYNKDISSYLMRKGQGSKYFDLSLFLRYIEKNIFSLPKSHLRLTRKKGDRALSKSILICISPMIYREKWLSNDWCETSNPFYTLLVSPFLCECIDIQRHIQR